LEPKSLFDWNDVLFQYLGFVSSFGMLGAVGFRYGVLRSGLNVDRAPSPPLLADALDRATADAASVGLFGVALGFVSMVEGLVKRAASKHQSVGDAFEGEGALSAAQLVLLVVLLCAFVIARRRVAVGWAVAALAAIGFALRSLLAGRVAAMVNPLHVLGASLWLGTLFVLIVCGVGAVLRHEVPPAERERAVAEMVARFSLLGLGGSALLGITGLIAAWTHLNPLSSLWTTPYGYALMSKLFVVTIVLGLGAWNWRRVGPSLGKEGGALTIRRSALTELCFAAVVLLLTAILVSVPSPKLPAYGSTDARVAPVHDNHSVTANGHVPVP
jgi:putative copper export protein